MKLPDLQRLARIARHALDPALSIILFTPGPIGNKLRYHYYRRRLRRCGRNVVFDLGVIIEDPSLVEIGDEVHIDKYCIINTGRQLAGKVFRKPNSDFAGSEGDLIIGSQVHIVQHCILMAFGGMQIGDRCTLSAGTKLYSLTNLAYDPEDRARVISIMPYSQAPFLAAPVVLKENVWLGLNCVVMPGTTVGENSFAVSNSLLNSRFPPNSYLQGQPARATRKRFGLAG